MADRQKLARAQFSIQEKLAKDTNTMMALHPGYAGKNVKKEEEAVLDAGCWTEGPSPIPSSLFDSGIKESSEVGLKVKKHFSGFLIRTKETLH